MHLAEFILANIEPIARDWEKFAKTSIPGSNDASRAKTGSAPLDDVARVLRAVAKGMEKSQTSADQEANGKGPQSSGSLGAAASLHDGLRIESTFDLERMVSEYRAMRACVLRLWSDSHPDGLSEEALAVIRFNEAIDQSVAEMVPTYLQRESQYRDRSFGMLGHDLRTPINAIHLSATALSRAEGLSENGARCVSQILNSTQRLDRMVRDILDFTRGRFGEPMHVNRTPADLKAILPGIIDELQCAYPNVVIELTANGDLRGEWDSGRLSQLISNLAMNAIQHGAARQISIKMTKENDRVLIEVHNDGLSIPPHLTAAILNPLGWQRPSDHPQAGLGLGLFICQQIVKAHKGTITVTSSPAAGTTFAVRLNRCAE